jgi:hypothetical protein
MTQRYGEAFKQYEAQLQAPRGALDQVHGLKWMGPDASSQLTELFLMCFCAQGARITEPVPGWIRRAGERCIQVGLPELGDALMRHAKHEAGHHLMMIDDARSVAARWNQRERYQIDVEELLSLPLQPGAQAYIDLHEQVIASDKPFGQIAVEYEIEMMSTRVGPRFISACVQQLGPEILKCLTFVSEHTEVDVGHTQLNAYQLDKLLTKHPQHLDALVEAGQAALISYGEVFTDSMRLAERYLAKAKEAQRAVA